MDADVLYRFHKSRHWTPVLSQLNPTHTFVQILAFYVINPSFT